MSVDLPIKIAVSKASEKMKIEVIIFVASLFAIGCASTAPRLDSSQIRPWSNSLESEYPNDKSVIAHYKKGSYELSYLAARHTNTMDSDTMRLVQHLIEKEKINVLLIESIPHSSGESPQWFVEESKKGLTDAFVPGGESALAVALADQKRIPFFAGEPDHQDIYRGLKDRKYTDQDVIGFYTVRQIPQWVRQRENKNDLFKRKIPPYLKHYCKVFGIQDCPSMDETLKWYKSKLGHELSVDISNEETAPVLDGTLFTQKMSSEVGYIRDHFTLGIIEKLLQQYKKIAAVYGAGHFITLRKSFEASMGQPEFIEDIPRSR